jgi:hypothetical protein
MMRFSQPKNIAGQPTAFILKAFPFSAQIPPIFSALATKFLEYPKPGTEDLFASACSECY